MEKAIDLIVDGFRDQWMAVPNIEAANTTCKIEIAIAVDIFDPWAFGLCGENRGDKLRSPRNSGFAAGEQCAGLGTRNFSSDFDRFFSHVFPFQNCAKF